MSIFKFNANLKICFNWVTIGHDRSGEKEVNLDQASIDVLSDLNIPIFSYPEFQ